MQLTANTEVLKEPRGFIKLIEIILAICAFATAVGPHVAVTFKCCGVETVQLSAQYPYRVGETNLTDRAVCKCTGTTTVLSSSVPSSLAPTSDATDVTNAPTVTTTTVAPTVAPTEKTPTEFELPGECQSSSEFYVFVGVTAFLFSLAAIVFYVFAQDQYAGFGIIPKADFVVTVFFTLFWLFSSSAFAAALSKIKNSTDPSWLSANYVDCFTQCPSNQDGNYSTLNVSVIFGFLNMIVWGGNNWFLYKETNWFGSDSTSSLPQQSLPTTSTSEIQPKV